MEKWDMHKDYYKWRCTYDKDQIEEEAIGDDEMGTDIDDIIDDELSEPSNVVE